MAMNDWQHFIPGIINDSKLLTNEQILYNLRKASEVISKGSGVDWWLTDDGQSEL